ncbi:MAG: hydrogenase maturation protease [Deltaproteobacteria bacterium]|nr:hydrogenase maturation protease [Deltaproteobacteria bacterium]
MATPCSHRCWIIGYGNPQRRDDGIGPFVVNRLKGILEHKKEVRLLALHQLAVDQVEQLCKADLLLFVDATVENLDGGRTWHRVSPETRNRPYLTHHVQPSYLLGLIQALYHRSIPAWLVSIQGDDFGFGDKLSPWAERRAEKVSWEILQFIEKRSTMRKSIKTYKDTGVNHGKPSRHPYY